LKVKDTKKKVNINNGKKTIHPKSLSYESVTKSNVKKILNLKENFPNLLAKKIKEIHRMVNNTNRKKSKVTITMKGSLCQQIIIPMNSENIYKVLSKLSDYVTNFNRLLRNIKSNTTADFIRLDSRDIIITMNNVAIQSDLDIIEKYIKRINTISADNILSPYLPQSKSYFKILGISFLNEVNGISIKLDDIKSIIKTIYII